MEERSVFGKLNRWIEEEALLVLAAGDGFCNGVQTLGYAGYRPLKQLQGANLAHDSAQMARFVFLVNGKPRTVLLNVASIIRRRSRLSL